MMRKAITLGYFTNIIFGNMYSIFFTYLFCNRSLRLICFFTII